MLGIDLLVQSVLADGPQDQEGDDVLHHRPEDFYSRVRRVCDEPYGLVEVVGGTWLLPDPGLVCGNPEGHRTGDDQEGDCYDDEFLVVWFHTDNLHYMITIVKSPRRESNSRPPTYQVGVLPLNY